MASRDVDLTWHLHCAGWPPSRIDDALHTSSARQTIVWCWANDYKRSTVRAINEALKEVGHGHAVLGRVRR